MTNITPGLIFEQKDTDYVFGAANSIPFENRNSTGDWEQFLPIEERQSGRTGDTFGCASFSALNSLEAQLKWMMGFRPDVKQWLDREGFLDSSGNPNCSDAFTVVMSETTRGVGNSFQKVWNSIKKHGVCSQNMWDVSPDNLDAFYSQPNAQSRAQGLRFVEFFDVQYEIITKASEIAHNLKHAPVQIGTGICPGWSSGSTVRACNAQLSHATLCYRVNEDKTYADYDQYPPFKQVLAADYPMPYSIKGVISPLKELDGTPAKKKKPFMFDRDLRQGERSIDVSHLQDRLHVISPSTGYYGTMTAQAVRNYMKYRQIGTWFEQNVYPAGRVVTQAIRNELNK